MDKDKITFVLTIAGLAVQFFLAIFALWYTIETRLLRRHSAKQLKVLERQHLLAVSPYLNVGIVPKSAVLTDLKTNPQKVISVENPEDLNKKAGELVKELEGEKLDTFLCIIANPTSKLALEVEVLIYNHSNKHFLQGDVGQTVIEEKGQENIWVSGPPMDQDEIIAVMKKSYGDIDGIDKELLDYADGSYVVALFRDIENAVYVVKREFSIDSDGDVNQKRPSFKPLYC